MKINQTNTPPNTKNLEEMLEEIHKKHGKDHIISWDNHLEVMQMMMQS